MKFYTKKTRNCFFSRLVLLGLFSSTAVWADIVTFKFEGEVTHVEQAYRNHYSIGNRFYGRYDFNTDLDSDNNFSMFFPDAITFMSLTIENNEHVGEFYSASSGLIRETPDGYDFEFDREVSYYIAEFDLLKNHPEDLGEPTLSLEWNMSYESSVIRTSNGLAMTPGFDRGWLYMGLNSWGDIEGTLNSVSVVSSIPAITIPDNTWLQIGLKTAPPAGNATVADIVGDDISASYDTDWVLYSYETSTNTYKKLSLTDTMHPGVGYWFFQATGHAVTIDMPGASTDVNVAQHPACPSISDGCFEIPLQTSPIDGQWQMIGYPFRDRRNIDKLRIVTNSGECRIGCTLSQAKAEGIVSDTLWNYDGSAYQELTDSGSEPFEPWDGAWLATLPAASGMAPKLLIPAAN